MFFFMESRCATGAPRRMACTKGTTLLRPGDARMRATGFPKRDLLSPIVAVRPCAEVCGGKCLGCYSIAGKGVRGRNDASSILRPASRAPVGRLLVLFAETKRTPRGQAPAPFPPTFLALPFDTLPPRPLLYFLHERGDSIERMALSPAADCVCMEPAVLPGALFGAAQASAAEADRGCFRLRGCGTFLRYR